MILVDTSVWIDYFNGVSSSRADILDKALLNQTVLTGDLILAEILQGFSRDKDFRQARNALIHLDCVSLAGKKLALKAASNYRFLRSKGITVRKTVDMLIATWCLEAEVELLYSDNDFDRFAEHLPLKTAV